LQITNEIKTTLNTKKGINVVAIYGGASITDQAREIRGGTNYCGDPGRMHMINRGLVNISN
jgi:ATP-dependent RNA helicase DeaD